MHNNSPAQDLGLGVLICFVLIVVFIAAILFYSIALLTLAAIASVGLWAISTLWQAGKGNPQYRDEVLVLGGICITSGLALAVALGSWTLSVDWTHRPALLTMPQYLQFLTYNCSLAILLYRSRAHGLDSALVSSVSSTFAKMSFRSALGFMFLAVVVTHATIPDGLVFMTSMAPLLFLVQTSHFNPKNQHAT